MEGFLFSGIFWGSILIIWGISIVVNSIFHIDIPIFRILVAFVFVYIGVKMLFGGYRISGKTDKNTTILSENRMQYNEDNREFNIIFGKGYVDLTGISLKDGNVDVKVNTVFGQGIIEIDSKIPVKIRASAAFGDIILPDDSVTSFGRNTYKSSEYEKGKNYLDLETDTVFGSTRVVNKKK